LNTNGLEIKQRVQRGMAFLDLAIIFFIVAKNLSVYGKKWHSDFGQKYEIHIFSVSSKLPVKKPSFKKMID